MKGQIMGKKFDLIFDEVIEFVPRGYYISRNVFPTKEEAQAEFHKYTEGMGEPLNPISLDSIKEAYVRFSPTPWEMRDEIGNMAWLTCERSDKRAQPCWVYGD